jgi:COX assembly protein 1
MTEERLDAAKLDYIANRSERGREAVEKLFKERQEKLLRMSGRKENNPNFPSERQV